jgi:hypothetical protein
MIIWNFAPAVEKIPNCHLPANFWYGFHFSCIAN